MKFKFYMKVLVMCPFLWVLSEVGPACFVPSFQVQRTVKKTVFSVAVSPCKCFCVVRTQLYQLKRRLAKIYFLLFMPMHNQVNRWRELEIVIILEMSLTIIHHQNRCVAKCVNCRMHFRAVSKICFLSLFLIWRSQGKASREFCFPMRYMLLMKKWPSQLYTQFK